MLNIKNAALTFKNALTDRKSTEYIIVHHRAGNGDVKSIHSTHLANGWSGIGYHFYIRKDGTVFSGRPINKSGAHTTGYNSVSVGVCFEGNFETENMSAAQLDSGRELIEYLKGKYPKAQVKRHRDFNSTACPGKKFPFDQIIKAPEAVSDTPGIVRVLFERGIITHKALWLAKAQKGTDAYWLCFKAANLTVNADRHKNLGTVNDIVWELNHRGIITQKELWLKLLSDDKDLYWLAYKICNNTKNRQEV